MLCHTAANSKARSNVHFEADLKKCIEWTRTRFRAPLSRFTGSALIVSVHVITGITETAAALIPHTPRAHTPRTYTKYKPAHNTPTAHEAQQRNEKQSRAEHRHSRHTHLAVRHLNVEVLVRAHDRHGLLHIEHMLSAGNSDGTQLGCVKNNDNNNNGTKKKKARPYGERDGTGWKEEATDIVEAQSKEERGGVESRMQSRESDGAP